MKLQVKHSRKYLALAKDNSGRAVQNTLASEWIFISDDNREVDPKSGDFGRIVLKDSKNPSRCLQPSSNFPRDRGSIDLAPIQVGNDSQLWKFILEDEDGFYVIENRNERREDGRNIRITQACMDVCRVRTDDETMVIVYHINETTGSVNQRWKIINPSDDITLI